MLFSDYNGRNIRITEERWRHINERHPETMGNEKFIEATMSSPDFIQEGNKGELLSIKKFKKTPVTDNKYCIVVYKLENMDGFLVTSYFTRRPSFRRKLIWKK
ncbi:MAG: hypothetical protein AB1480_18160 [Nitrospirota bacterium]